MKYKNWDNFKVHCSGISRLMSRPKGINDLTKANHTKQAAILAKEEKSEKDLETLESFRQKHELFINAPLSAGAKSYLVERYSSEKYNIRTASSGGKQKPVIAKGIALEKEGVDLMCFLDKVNYQKPEKPISNDYIIGACDAICQHGERLIEIKTSWNAANFMSNRIDNRMSLYHWMQFQGYLDLYNLETGQVCFVLVNTPQHLIDQERASLFRRYTFGEITRERYEQEVEKYESIFDYSKIPIKKRVIRFDVPRSSEFIERLYRKVSLSREYLNEFERLFLSNKNILTLPEHYINVPTEEDITECNTPDSLQSNTGG